MPPSKRRQELLKKLSLEYQDLNGHFYETLEHPPSPVEFLRLVHISRPVVIKNFKFSALNKWSDDYLIDKMGSSYISVAVTPDGNADAVVCAEDGRTYFVEPHVETITFEDLFKRLTARDSDEVHYLQSQNGNLFSNLSFQSEGEDKSEFDSLREDVPREIPWVSEALGMPPDAVNIWVGNDRSVTSVHSDPYENIYTVVRGIKHFTLFPPTEGWCLRERMYPHAKYKRRGPEGPLFVCPSPPHERPVRWSSVRDPLNTAELPSEAQPLHITLCRGESLYLPAGWWHHVRQSGLTIAINWWYDMEARGMNWVWMNFLRGDNEEVLADEDMQYTDAQS